MKKLLFYILLLGNLIPAQSQTFSKDRSSVIGKIFKQIREIKKFENYREEDNILIENKTGTGFSRISDGSNTIVLFAKYIAPASSKILATLDIGKVEKKY